MLQVKNPPIMILIEKHKNTDTILPCRWAEHSWLNLFSWRKVRTAWDGVPANDRAGRPDD